MSHDVSRRSFFGGVAAALGYLGLGPSTDLFAQNRPGAAGNAPRMRQLYDQQLAERPEVIVVSKAAETTGRTLRND